MSSTPAHIVLISAPYFQPVVDYYRHEFKERGLELRVPKVNERLSENELLALMDGVIGVISGDDAFTSKVIETSTQLQVISKWGTGIDSIDMQACQDFGVVVTRTKNAFSEPVADSAVGYALAFLRNIPQMTKAMRAGRWEKIPGRALNECTVGIIGVGDVGKAFVRRMQPFGARLIACDPIYPGDDFCSSTGLNMCTQGQVLQEADILSLHCDLNPTSHHLINTETLSLMKTDTVLINTARGAIIDEAALIQTLANNRLGGVGLDVFEREPLPQDSPLLSFERVLVAAHNSNSSPKAWHRVHRSTLDNLFSVLDQGPIK